MSAKRPVKKSFLHQLNTMVGMAAYLLVIHGLLQLHEQIVRDQYHIPYRLTGLVLINAFVLAKLMLIAEDVHLGERFKDRLLIYPIIYKSILFAAVFVGAYVAEETIMGVIGGHTVMDSIPKIGAERLTASTMILAVLLIPFFAWREIDRALGPAKLRNLVLNSRSDDAGRTSQRAATPTS